MGSTVLQAGSQDHLSAALGPGSAWSEARGVFYPRRGAFENNGAAVSNNRGISKGSGGPYTIKMAARTVGVSEQTFSTMAQRRLCI